MRNALATDEDRALAPDQDRAWPTLVEMCRAQAAADPGRRIFRFLENGVDESDVRTLADLDLRARAIAARLSTLARPGDRALLSFAPGLDFADAFFGCLYAGMIAVPVAPVEGDRNDIRRSRLEAIADSSQPRLLLGTTSALEKIEPVLGEIPATAGLAFVPVDEINPAAAAEWTAPPISPDSIAYLQFSSGSTGLPKGVVLSHANVLHNLALILANGSRENEDDDHLPPPFVSWLPNFHDMGLVSGVIEPIYVGYDVVSMPPMAFVQRPVNWLRAISDLGEANSAGPNFAYELAARRVTGRQRQHLDLSGWTIAMVGAEPVRAETLNRFCEAFEPCGFRRQALFPSYGLAESTVMVSGGPVDHGAVIRKFSAEALGRGQVRPAIQDARARELVGCGQIQSSMTLVLADPATGQPCEPGQVGEIFVCGPSIGGGYWNEPLETERTFRASLPGYPGLSFLRTGDLGFVDGGQLFITGRAKDVIILDGLNHHPHDIELTVARSHPDIREGFCCAFSVDDGHSERLIVFAETTHRYQAERASASAAGNAPAEQVTEAEIVTAVKRAVAAEHSASVHEVRLVALGTLPFTSSAKLQRGECRSRYLAGDFCAS
jgi:acyl-CoA synthetase (AMP-forming)/AMP-acid ligase II